MSKAIDKAAGAEREVLAEGAPVKRMIPGADQNSTGSWIKDNGREYVPTETSPATPAAERWDGWGTALKPAHEPIVVARRPLAGTVAANVLEHGTGALNVDGCRVEGEGYAYEDGPGGNTFTVGGAPDGSRTEPVSSHPAGRWPANVVLDPETAAMLDEQSGEARSAGVYQRGPVTADGAACIPIDREGYTSGMYDDQGGPSRFFYCAKASRAERNAGLDGFPDAPSLKLDPTSAMAGDGRRGSGVAQNPHPTVKPIELMRWLVRLVTPPRGLVLDPFTGSGTTGCAAVVEGFDFLGCEREPEYAEIARARIAYWEDPAVYAAHMEEVSRAEALERGEAVQLGLLDGEAA